MATIYKNENIRWEEPKIDGMVAVFNISEDKMAKKETLKIKTPKKKKAKKKFKAKIKTVMREYKKGKLDIGKSTKKVKSRAQAIAISLSEASKAVKKKKKGNKK